MQLKTSSDGSISGTLSKLVKLAPQPVKLSRALAPIDFVRWREFDFALRAASHFMSSPGQVLDLSSPKLLPLTIASKVRGCHVVATDILDREVNWVRSAGDRLGLMNLTARVEDARQLRFPDNRFDLITSVSVIEHIAPEHGGEIPAMREIARVLAPGGIAVITVPFSRSYFADYHTGNVYERENTNGEPIFFQRFYDQGMLMSNIVAASGLELASLGFIEERLCWKDPHKRVAHYVNGSPMQNFFCGPFYPLLSRIFLSAPKPLDGCTKPYLACIVLRKVTAPA
jgi:SAM-dependent methyltransferase